MTQDQIFAVVKKNILLVLAEVNETDITIHGSLKDLGANSIDRADIVVQSLEDLGLQIPLVELGRAQNLQGLVEILHQKIMAQR